MSLKHLKTLFLTVSSKLTILFQNNEKSLDMFITDVLAVIHIYITGYF